MKWILTAVRAILLVPCLSEGMQSKVDTATRQAVIDYLEQHLPVYGGAKNFVAFDFFGMSSHGKRTKVYGCSARQSFALVDHQVLQRSSSLVPMVVFVEQTAKRPKVTGCREAEEGEAYRPSIIKMFPRRFQEIAGNLPDDRRKTLVDQIRARVSSYFADTVKEGEPFKKEGPGTPFDPQKHNRN